MTPPRTLRVITGPTASGKSAFALRLAERFPLAILSADSRQIYRGFDIGTAKPTAVERATVPHAGIDLVEPTARYSAARWADEARRWADDWSVQGREPVIVGGTGFYLRALFEPLAPVPALDPARRAALEPVLALLPTGELRRWCAALDRPRAHLGRAQLLRAVETALLTGERLSDAFDAPRSPPPAAPRYLVVDPGPALAGRIEHRVDEMLRSGWLDEVRALAARVAADAPAWNATGYDAIRELVAGRSSLAEARTRVIVATRQYAKRQRTWMRHQLPGNVTRIDPTTSDALERAIAWWEGDDST